MRSRPAGLCLADRPRHNPSTPVPKPQGQKGTVPCAIRNRAGVAAGRKAMQGRCCRGASSQPAAVCASVCSPLHRETGGRERANKVYF